MYDLIGYFRVHSTHTHQATPHAVRGCATVGEAAGEAGGEAAAHASRESFAVFMQPWAMEPMAVPAGIRPAVAQVYAQQW